MKNSDITALLTCPIFSGLTKSDVGALEKEVVFDVRTFGKGSGIFTPEDFRKALAFILKGSAEVYKTREDASPMLMSIQQPGAVFGIPTLFCDGYDFPTTVRARENCRILFLDKSAVEKMFSLYPVTVNNYLELLSRKIFFLNERLERLSAPDTKSRLKAYLEAAAGEAGSKEYILPVSCSELSSLLSVGRTSLYRAFDELAEENFMARDRKNIKLL